MTDLYAFPKPGDPARSILVLNVHPSFRLDSPELNGKVVGAIGVSGGSGNQDHAVAAAGAAAF